MSKYVDFDDIDVIFEDLTPEENKELQDIETEFERRSSALKEELIKLEPPNKPKNWRKENYTPESEEENQEWLNYVKIRNESQEWRNKNKELDELREDYNNKRNALYDKIQERRFTEKIKTVGIEKFFKERIRVAEGIIKKVEEEKNKDSKDRTYTEYGLQRLLEVANEVIEASKKIIEKAEVIKAENIQDLSFSEIMDLIDIKGLTDEKEEIELLDSIIPRNYIIPNNRLINKMAKDEIPYNKEFDLKINGEAKKQILTKVSINYDDENIQIYDKDKRFTPYDRTVHNAICSIYDAGNTNFTPDQVYRAMNGLDDKQFVSPQAIGSITRSIDKSRRIYAKVDYTNEAKAYRKDVNSCIVEDYILSAKKITLEAGGHKVTGYKLNNKPLLYEYAQVTGQVLTVPSKLLNTKDVIRSTQDVIIIREYLIRRIEVMKKSNNQSNRILLERVYEELNEQEPTKETSRKVRNIIDALLSKYVNEKYIKNYKYFKEGRAYKGVEIIY